jgi:hypothetical protein
MNTPVLVALLLAAGALFVLGVWIVFRIRRNSSDRERRRRLAVNARGRLGDATITDIAGDTIYYSYTVHGVVYDGSQDISQLRGLLNGDPERMVGPVSMKYSPRNPANSIVICEEWSGLRENSKSG